jgi:hypothetical protein
MKKRNVWLLVGTLTLILGTGMILSRLKGNQRLGTPGIKAAPIPGSVVMNIDLPSDVLDYTSSNVPQPKVVLDYLPKDTSYAQRRYMAPDGFWVNANIIMMGMDRTSIHNPEICLPGQGWKIDVRTNLNLVVRDGRPLSVAKWVASNSMEGPDGQKIPVRGIYVFWFVADNEQTSVHSQRLWWMARDMLLTGVLQRWAYVSYFAICSPGQEDATFERMSRLIEESVPEFQLPPRATPAASVARQ